MDVKYAKFNIMGDLEYYNGSPIQTSEKVLINPTEQQLIDNGWLPMFYMDYPEEEPGYEISSEIIIDDDKKCMITIYHKNLIDKPLDGEIAPEETA